MSELDAVDPAQIEHEPDSGKLCGDVAGKKHDNDASHRTRLAGHHELPQESDETRNKDEEAEEDEEDEHAELIASLQLCDLVELALSARHIIDPDIPNVTCEVEVPPKSGAFNLVYKVLFSDGLAWALRIPAREDVHSVTFQECMRLDIIAQQFIASKTSMPIPRIHHWSNTSNNPISRPFVVCDYVDGTPLYSVWNDRQWISDEKRRYIFKQLAEWLTQLASFEFDAIGCLDYDEATGTYRVVPFPDFGIFYQPYHPEHALHPGPAGPFHSAQAFMSRALHMRRAVKDSGSLVMLQMLFPLLADPTLDGAPFVLGPPDFESQNVLVADDRTITAILDWDEVYVGPRQSRGTAYPSWLTVDWDPLYYGWHEKKSEEENARFDAPDELVRYRQEFLTAAVDVASGGKYTEMTRNSHIFQNLTIGIVNEVSTGAIVNRLLRLVFGSDAIGYDFQYAIQAAPFSSLPPGVTIEMPPGHNAEVLKSTDSLSSGANTLS